MLTNSYTAFGNDMLSKYAGMVSAINPLSLFYLKNETQEEMPVQQQTASVTYIQNHIKKVNHHHYHTMANRYVINYQNTMNLIASNPVYEKSPNFRQDIMPARLIHAEGPKNEDERKEETRVFVKELLKQVISEYKETSVTEHTNEQQIRTFLSVLAQAPQLQLKILPMLEKSVQTVWTKHQKENNKESVREMTEVFRNVCEQAAQKMPDQYRKLLTVSRGQNLRIQTQEIVTKKEIDWLVQKVTEKLTQASANQVYGQEYKTQVNTVITRRESIGRYTESVQRKQRIAKERFQTQVMGRISPLPVRPVSYVFPKENAEEFPQIKEQTVSQTEANTILQKIDYVMKKETGAEYKYYTHILEKFLKKEESVKSQKPDRSQLPAGIIWHQKPKETVSFERREILQVPMHLVYDKPYTKNQDVKENLLSEIGQETNYSVRTEKSQLSNSDAAFSTGGAVEKGQNNKISESRAVSDAVQQKRSSSELPYYEENYDYQKRQLVRKWVPDFTRTSDSIQLIKNEEIGEKLSAVFSNSKDAITYSWKSGVLELVLPSSNTQTQTEEKNQLSTILQQMVVNPKQVTVQESYRSMDRSMQPLQLAHHKNEILSLTDVVPVAGQNAPGIAIMLPPAASVSGRIPVTPAAALTAAIKPGELSPTASVNGSEIAGTGNSMIHTAENLSPAQLLHAQHQTAVAQNAAQQQLAVAQNTVQTQLAPVSLLYKSENAKNDKQQQEIKKIEEKTEFLEDIVFEKKVVTKDTRYQYHTSKQESSETVDAESAVPYTGVTGAVNQASAVLKTEVDGIVQESVSRHVDESISKISRQVYKEIERQLKKERERRGLK